MATTKAVTFEEWQEMIDEICDRKFGISIDDLPDQDYLSYFEDGYSPRQALMQIAEEEGLEVE